MKGFKHVNDINIFYLKDDYFSSLRNLMDDFYLVEVSVMVNGNV